MSRFLQLFKFLVVLVVVTCPLIGPAQTATVLGAKDQACAGTRAAKNLGCTANDLTAQITFTQPAATAITSCVAGQYISLDVIASLASGSPDRYAIGVFLGQSGNYPSRNNAADLCSVGVFPSTPAPFANLDGGAACGDFLGSSTATLQITGVKANCMAAPGTNQLSIPYLLAWDNQVAPSCTAANLTASTNSKCNENVSSYVTGVTVLGYIRLTKQTDPASTTQTFSFSTTASPTASVTPSSVTLTTGQSQTFTFPLSITGGVRQITLTEALSAGWESTATIACTTPSGASAASYITVNNANRTISGNFSLTDYAAICTITNNKQTRMRVRKTVPNGDTGTFSLAVQTDLGLLSAVNQGNGALTGYQQSYQGNITVTETSGSNASITKYVSAVTCTNDVTGAVIAPVSTSLAGVTRSVVLTPPAHVDSTCAFTNTRSANVSLTKSNGAASVVAGSTTTYLLSVTNIGPSDADGTVLADPASAGLQCNQVSCNSTSGGAVCPSAGTLTIPALQGSGIALPALPSGSSLSLAVTCGVTATGS
ncbi:MAG: DUF11 domain-containing protein [Bdellovibrionales bacterium]|nr:DUF11 domain-containing protein [Ramlibacter sp.]